MLFLVQSKWHDDGRGSIQLGDLLKFIAAVRKVLDNDLDTLNSRIKDRRADIERALYDANARFVLVLAHTGQEGLSTDVASEIDQYINSQNDTSELMSLRVLSQLELYKAVAAGVAGAPITLEVQLAGWGQMREPYFAVYGQVCAADVAAWLHNHGNRLFERNLRQFITVSTVNQDIVTTLLSRPSDFWYFNNGITAIANSIAKKPIGGSSTESGIFECTGFSVVNGAQTVGSIHSAAEQKPDEVSRAMVSVRIVSIADSAFGLEVTRNTNTQNAVEKRDFVALDPEQERIRQELQFEGVEYAYKTGTPSTSSVRGFGLTEATIALACAHADVAMAVQAKREIGRLWDDIKKSPYTQLFNNSVNGPQIWEAVQTLRAIDAELQTEAKKYAGRDALVCVHGNRFIEWATFKKLGLGSSFTFRLSVHRRVGEYRRQMADGGSTCHKQTGLTRQYHRPAVGRSCCHPTVDRRLLLACGLASSEGNPPISTHGVRSPRPPAIRLRSTADRFVIPPSMTNLLPTVKAASSEARVPDIKPIIQLYRHCERRRMSIRSEPTPK